MTELDDESGRTALADGWAARYPDQPEPLIFETRQRYLDGGPDPLDEVRVYRSLVPTPHWVYVGAGLSDITPEHAANHVPRISATGAALSGWGVEFTLRLADPAAEHPDEFPPAWPPALLQQLARHVCAGGELFQSGSMVITGKPIVAGVDTALTGMVFTSDPELSELHTEAGLVQFLAVLPITNDEATFAGSKGTEAFVTLLLAQHPQGIFALDRKSVLTDSELLGPQQS